MIQNNIHNYSVSPMCEVLQIPRSAYYDEAKEIFNVAVSDLTYVRVGMSWQY